MSGDSETHLVIGFKRKKNKVAKTSPEINAALRQGSSSERKPSGGQNKARQGTDHQRIAKIDRENEVAPPSKVPLAVGQAIQTARQKLGLSQKEVAQRVNEKPSVIQDYESGKAIPSDQFLAKLERKLYVKLRGSDIGKELQIGRRAVAEPVLPTAEPVESEVAVDAGEAER